MHSLCRQATILILAASFTGWLSIFAIAQAAPATVPALVDALQRGQNADALRISAELLHSGPPSHKVWTLRAMALEQAGQPKEALAAYQRAIKLAPDYLLALEGAAQLNYKALSAQDFAAAEQVLDSQPSALMAYSICLARLNRSAEAMAHLQKLLDARPTDAAVRYDLALLQWHSGSGADALATLQPMLDAANTDSRVLRLAAAVHEANNETPQAIELLRAAIAANPDEPIAIGKIDTDNW
jgi:Flp pilus assembly protein TadD